MSSRMVPYDVSFKISRIRAIYRARERLVEHHCPTFAAHFTRLGVFAALRSGALSRVQCSRQESASVDTHRVSKSRGKPESFEMALESDNPDIQWALKVLSRHEQQEPNIFMKYWGEFALVGTANGLYILKNIALRRPLYASLYRQIAVGVGAFFIGRLARMTEVNSRLKHTAFLRSYIIAHPDDFPEPVRKKFGEVLLPWTPVR